MQIVNVVNEDPVQLVHLRIDIARYGDIDEKHRAVLSSLKELQSVLASEDRMRGTRRGDDDVRSVRRIVELVKADRFALESARQFHRTIVRPVRDKY